MLNSNGTRELAYIVKVDDVVPMNADKLECAQIGGWNCVVGKSEVKKGDVAVYFESDSQLSEVEPFAHIEFLKAKHFKIKPQKIRGVVSHGLLLPVEAFGWSVNADGNVVINHKAVNLDDDSRFVTKLLGVTYNDPADNIRKKSNHRQSVTQWVCPLSWRTTKWWHAVYHTKCGKWMLIKLFMRKKKSPKWPEWVVKTDEERWQSLPTEYLTSCEWIATEKIDGTSCTFTMKGFGRKRKFLVCSRNVPFFTGKEKCYYENNVYLEMAQKYDIESVMSDWMDKLRSEDIDIEFLTLQGEIFGAGVQKRKYIDNHDIAIFNVIYGYRDGETIRLNPVEGKMICRHYGLEFVPIVGVNVTLPADRNEMAKVADGMSMLDGGMREGIVFRSVDGKQSFKAVSDEYLMRYHS